MLSNQEKEELKKLVIDNDLSQVFARLGLVSDLKKTNDLVVLEAEYRRLKQENITHEITKNEYETGLNKMNKSLMQIINDLEEYSDPEKKGNSSKHSSKKDKKMFHTIGRRDDLKGLEKTELVLLTNFLDKVQQSRRKINGLLPNSHYLPDLIGILVGLDKELKQKESRWGEEFGDSALLGAIKTVRTRTNGLLTEITQERRAKNEFDASEYIRCNVAPYFQNPLEVLELEIARTIKKLSVK